MKNYSWSLFSLVWAGLIVYLSFIQPVSVGGVPWFKNQDKLGHFVFYAILGLTLIKALSQEIIIQNPLTGGALVALVFGVLIELCQHFFTYNRDGNFLDALANGFGILLMVVLIKIHDVL